MSNPTDTVEEEALLMELARLGMGVVRQVHGLILQTTEPERLLALVTAYTHVSRGVRQSLALKARFVAGTVAPVPRAETAQRTSDADAEHHDSHERDDSYERPDWHTRLERPDAVEPLHADDDVNRERIARNLTIVSRTPALAAISALKAPAAHLAGRAALLTGASLKLVNSS